MLVALLVGLASVVATARATPGVEDVAAVPRVIDVDGTRLRVVVRGQGIPCLVIGSSVYYPRTFASDLDRHLRLHFVDLRWFAAEYRAVALDRYTLDSIVDDVERIRTALKLDAMVLVGHSIHGTIALEYARRHPTRVSRLVLIGAPALLGSPEYESGAEAMWATASDERRTLQADNWRRHRPPASPASQVIDDYLTMAPKYWFDPRYDARWLWRDMTIQADLLGHVYGRVFAPYRMFGTTPAVPVPTLVLLGRHDYIVPPTQWEPHASLPGLTLRVLARSGHTPQLEEPGSFAQHLLDWLGPRLPREGDRR